MWERLCYARGWCRLKVQTKKEPIYHHYIGVLRHIDRPQKTHTRGTKKLHTTYASPSETRVSRYECGKIFPAGLGPDSLSRDVANWLSSQLAGRLRRGGGMVG